MKTAQEWQELYAKDKLNIRAGLIRNIAWSDGSLIKAIQADTLQEAIDTCQALHDSFKKRLKPDDCDINKLCNISINACCETCISLRDRYISIQSLLK